jgi:hypothetical protein
MWKISSADALVVSVDTVAHRSEADASIAEFLDQLDEVVLRTSDSVEASDDQRICLLHVREAGIQFGALALCARDLVDFASRTPETKNCL